MESPVSIKKKLVTSLMIGRSFRVCALRKSLATNTFTNEEREWIG